ncbi:unnamed protein product [Orchesella dallaii]|uniref:DNA replication complex GINS protein PSF3 n=1 Tax=Orchesella dallaii TaxID=48710 RepID=A0ABP1Q7A7_9HEXA
MTSKDLRTAYNPNYFSIESILASQTLVPCRTEMRLPKFGFLVPDCNSEDLPVGTDLELPIWAARVLCRPRRIYVSVDIPPGFKETHREVVEEDPTAATVDLKKVNVNYYEAGHMCTSLFHHDAGELAEMLPEVLQQRILCIGSAIGATVERNSPLNQDRMDILEEKLFKDAKDCNESLEDWLQPFGVPPEIEAELRRPPPPPPSPPKQVTHHHQQYPHRHTHQLPPAPAHSQLPPPIYGNPYAHLQQSGSTSPYGTMSMSSHQGLGMPQNIAHQQIHGQIQSHNNQGQYPHHSHNMYMK